MAGVPLVSPATVKWTCLAALAMPKSTTLTLPWRETRTLALLTSRWMMPSEVLEFFHAIGLPISEVWGMSELAAVGTRNPERIKIGSIGTALPGVELRLASDGELQI